MTIRVLLQHLLQQGLGLAARVIRSEVLVLLHLLLNGQQLTLQFAAQSWQCISDVIGELLAVTKRCSVVIYYRDWKTLSTLQEKNCSGWNHITMIVICSSKWGVFFTFQSQLWSSTRFCAGTNSFCIIDTSLRQYYQKILLTTFSLLCR